MRYLILALLFSYSSLLWAHGENEALKSVEYKQPNLTHSIGNTFLNDELMKQDSAEERIAFLATQFNDTYDDPNKTPAPDKLSKFYPKIGKFNNVKDEVNFRFYKLFNTGALNAYYIETIPGAVTPTHYHKDYQLMIYQIDGISLNYWGDKLQHVVVTKPGDVLYVPPGVCHQIVNLSKTIVARILEIRTQGESVSVRVPCAEGIGIQKANLYS